MDGVVRRNASGKELRQGTILTAIEQEIARRICMAFGQTVCGFDLVRTNGHSYVIDVNGWSFVKGSTFYYDTCASILKDTFLKAATTRSFKYSSIQSFSSSSPTNLVTSTSSSWRLKSYISVIRHADRTPKQKLKFHLPSDSLFKAFTKNGDVSKDSINQVLIKDPINLKLLSLVLNELIFNYGHGSNHLKADTSTKEYQDHLIAQLKSVQNIVDFRIGQADTKVQLRRLSNNDDNHSLLVVIKWGGEFTHAGRHHAQEFGESLRTDLKILNRSLLNDIIIYSSEERRVKATAIITAKALLHLARLPSGFIINSPDLLDDNLEAKDEMDTVKTSIRHLMSSSIKIENYFPKDSYSQELVDDPKSFIVRLTDHLFVHYVTFSQVSKNLLAQKWCCLDSALLWRERWLKIFKDVLPLDNISKNSSILPLLKDPGRVCELWDSLKYDSIHNRSYLELLFTGNMSPSEFLKSSLHELFIRTKALYDFISPSEYGITPPEKISIGKKIIGNLLLQLVNDLKKSRLPQAAPSTRLYVTKESHLYPLLNMIQYGGLSTWISKQTQYQLELDYLSQITFEIYERYPIINNTDMNISAEFSLRISLSQGAYNPCILDVHLDERHCLSVGSREWISEYIPLDTAIDILTKDLFS